MFMDKEHRGPFEFSEEIGNLSLGAEAMDNVIPAQRFVETDNDLLLSTSEKEENGGQSTNGSVPSGYNAPSDYSASLVPISSQPQAGAPVSSHGTQVSSPIDDLLGLGSLDIPVASASPSLRLNPKAALDPGTFQRKWGQLAISSSQECSMSPQGILALAKPQVLIRHMQGDHINCIASGGQSPNFKFFFYAQMLDFFLVECVINSSSGKAQIKVKADGGSASEAFSILFQSSLLKLGV